jgi:hypothetical protein
MQLQAWHGEEQTLAAAKAQGTSAPG